MSPASIFRVQSTRKPNSASCLLHAGFLLGLFFSPDVPLKRRLNFKKFHGLMSLKTGLVVYSYFQLRNIIDETFDI
jgi:hypothetical protein